MELQIEIANALRSRKIVELDGLGRRKGAVLIILYPEENDVNVIFILRSKNVPNHKGEISFPGGGAKEEDKDLMDTALRETYEEIGLRVSREQVLGRIDDYSTQASQFVVTPYIAFLNSKPEVCPDHYEVDNILNVPLSKLLAPNALEEGAIISRSGELRVPFYRHGEYKIWGATEKMLSGFLKIIRGLKSVNDP